MSRTTNRRVASAAFRSIESLEGRLLFAAQVVAQLPDTAGVTGSTQTVDLQPFFTDPQFSVVRLTMPQGAVDIRTLDQAVPANAANFLNYVNSGRYNGAIYHRSLPGFVLQGGSQFADGSAVPAFAPVVDEPSPLSNVRGTLAFARLPAFDDQNGNGIQDPGEQTIPGGGPDSATNGFFFNLVDNGANLDNQNGGFAVFGQVLGNGMAVVDTVTTVAAANPLNAPIQSAVVIDDVTYTVQSSDLTVVSPTIVDGNLQLNYGNTGGSATITVTATDLDGVTSVVNAFTATATFGVVLGGAGGIKSASFVDGDGTATTVSLKGDGSASIAFDGTGLTQTIAKGRTVVTGAGVGLAGITVTGSTSKTSVTISSKGGDGVTTLGGLTTDAAVRSISGKSTTLNGALTTGGATGSVTLAGANNAAITLGGTGADKAASLSLGTVTDTSMTFNGPVKSLKLTSATDSDGNGEVITAGVDVSSISVSGDLAEDINLTGEANLKSLKVNGDLGANITAHQIGSISVKGNVVSSTITNTHGAAEVEAAGGNPNSKREFGLSALKVGGAITGSTVNSAGSVGSISAASVSASNFLAGTAVGVVSLPAALADVPEPATINSVKVKGAYAGSNTGAKFLGKISVGSLTAANGGTPFGFAGSTIASLSGRTDSGQKFSVKKATTQAAVTTALTGVVLGDAVVRILEA